METVIKVDHLSKKYKVGAKEDYLTLRDQIAKLGQFPKSLLRWNHGEDLKTHEFWALKDLNFEVNKGEVMGIIGRNGAGKSTLLKVLSRITAPTGGQATINGKVISLLEVGTGFSAEMTGRENIYLNGTIMGMTRSEIKRKFDAIIDFSGVEKFMDTPVKFYSSGMYMRLAFSVAAHLESDIMLVDEVLAVGDIEFQKKSMNKMEEVTRNSGKTIIFVSHNLGAIQNLCHRSILLKEGQIDDIGKTSKVVAKYIGETTKLMKIDLSKRKDRDGNGKIRITNVDFFDSKGKPVKNLVTGEDFTAIVKYKVFDRSIKSINFSMPIDETVYGNRLFHLSSSWLGQTIKVTGSTGVIKVHFKKIPLIAGNYSFNVWVDYHGEMLDWVQQAGNFDVTFGDYYNSGKQPDASQGSVLVDYIIE